MVSASVTLDPVREARWHASAGESEQLGLWSRFGGLLVSASVTLDPIREALSWRSQRWREGTAKLVVAVWGLLVSSRHW